MGNGWLRESPSNPVPRVWDVKSRSALRKCMFMEMPAHLRQLAAALPRPAPLPVPAWRPPTPRPEAPIQRHARNPANDVRMMPARPVPQNHRAAPPKGDWWEDPLALGLLLVLAPPVGLACAWTSRRYSNEARWALTVMTTLMMAIVGAVAIALILR